MRIIDNNKKRADGLSEKSRPQEAKGRYHHLHEVPAGLVEALQRGENEAFDKLYLHFSKPLFDFLLRLLHDEEDAKNILQDTFLYIFEKKESLDFTRNVKGLLYTLSKRKAIDLFRQSKRDERARSEYYTGDAEPSLEAGYIRDEISEIMAITVKTMPEMRRKIFLMQQAGKSNTEIANELGLAKSTVSLHLKAARDDIRDVIYVILLFFLI